MRFILIILAGVTLSSCTSGHETLKAPCPPVAGIAGSPCERAPFDLAFVESQSGEKA